MTIRRRTTGADGDGIAVLTRYTFRVFDHSGSSVCLRHSLGALTRHMVIIESAPVAQKNRTGAYRSGAELGSLPLVLPDVDAAV